MIEKLKELQLKLASKISLKDELIEIKKAAGVDVHYNKKAIACAVVLDRRFRVVEKVTAKKDIKFPYIPGLLAFRELPAAIKAIKKLSNSYDVIFVNGHGIAHPRGFGLASHLGLVLDRPTIGVAKGILCGEIRGSKIVYKGRVVGYKLGRMYISPGHKISPETALKVAKLFSRFSMPEPLRLAHLCLKSL